MFELKLLKEIPDTYDEMCAILPPNHVGWQKGKNMIFIRMSGSNELYCFYIQEKDSYIDALRGSAPDEEFTQILCRKFDGWYWIGSSSCYATAMSRVGEPSKKMTLAYIKQVVRITNGHIGASYNPKRDVPSLGVELELESYSDGLSKREALLNWLCGRCAKLVYSVTTDGSVMGGTELRFSHPTLKRWSAITVDKILRKAKDLGFVTEKGTAGMHIHMSFAKKDLGMRIAYRFSKDIKTMKKILYPICARGEAVGSSINRTENRYGLGHNMTRGFTRHETFELRIWEATMNPAVFMARVKFADYFARFMASDTPLEAFFQKMDDENKKNYEFLLRTENPHVFGCGLEDALTMLYK